MITITQDERNVNLQFPKNLVGNDYVEKFLSYLHFAELASKNKMKKKDADAFSENVKNDWWNKNKSTFLKKVKK